MLCKLDSMKMLHILCYFLYIFIFNLECFAIKRNSCCDKEESIYCSELSRTPGAWNCTCVRKPGTSTISDTKSEIFVLLLESSQMNNLENCLHGLLSSTTLTHSFSTVAYLNVTGRHYMSSEIELNKFNLTVFTQTESLILDKLLINRINASFFKTFPFVSSISLKGNHLENISHSFHAKSLKTLLSLDLSNNRIVDLKESAFSQTKALKSLNLSGNKILTIRKNIFCHLNRLTSLDLSGNMLTKVASELFSGLFKLRNLNLQLNRIEHIKFSDMIFNDSTVNSMNVCPNKKAQKYKGKWALGNLRSLDISFNLISDFFSHTTFKALCKLKELSVKQNHLNEFSFPPFMDLPSLQFLDFSKNNISLLKETNHSRTYTTERDSFSCCKVQSLKSENCKFLELDLAENKITELPTNAFKNMCNLNAIDVSQNNISRVHTSAFNGLPYLNTLNLSNNNLHDFRIKSKLMLTSLDLSHNSMLTASPNWINLIKKYREGKLLLGGNQLKCDENLAKIFMSSSCNEIRESEMYTNSSIQQLLELKKLFHGYHYFTLSDPGECVVVNNVGTCNEKLNTDVHKCALQSYLELLAVSKGKYRKKIFKLLLNNIENLYNYVKIVAAKTRQSDFAEIKQSVVQGIVASMSSMQLEPGESLLDRITSDIAVGVVETNNSIEFEDKNFSRRGLQFSISSSKIQVFGNGIKEIKFDSSPISLKMSHKKQTCEENENREMTEHNKISIFLPKSTYAEGSSQKVAFVAYKNAVNNKNKYILISQLNNSINCRMCNQNKTTNITCFKPPASNVEIKVYQSEEFYKTLQFLFPSNEKVNVSSVISANIFGKIVTKALEPIEISTDVIVESETSNETFSCVYWDFTDSTWTNVGCHFQSVLKIFSHGRWRARVTCYCNHLTNFAVLLNYDMSKSPTISDDIPTNVVSYTGLIVSIISLFVTIVYRLKIRELRRGVPQLILLHLCVSLLLLYILLLFHDKKGITQNDSICLSIALSLHFFLLSTWGWQVIEGISMYMLLVRVFNVKIDKFITKASIFGYGIACFFVVSSVSYSLAKAESITGGNFFDALNGSYRYGSTCIVSYPNNIYFVLVPVSICIFVNTVTFIFIIRTLNRSTKSDNEGNSTKMVKNRLRQAICVTSLLGITWFVGIVKIVLQSTLEPSSELKQSTAVWVWELIFSTCNSLQGFFIFLMFCAARVYKESKLLSSTCHAHLHRQHVLMSSSAVNPQSISTGQTTVKSWPPY